MEADKCASAACIADYAEWRENEGSRQVGVFFGFSSLIPGLAAPGLHARSHAAFSVSVVPAGTQGRVGSGSSVADGTGGRSGGQCEMSRRVVYSDGRYLRLHRTSISPAPCLH